MGPVLTGTPAQDGGSVGFQAFARGQNHETKGAKAGPAVAELSTGPRRFALLIEACKPAPHHPGVSGFGTDDVWVKAAVRFILAGLPPLL